MRAPTELGTHPLLLGLHSPDFAAVSVFYLANAARTNLSHLNPYRQVHKPTRPLTDACRAGRTPTVP